MNDTTVIGAAGQVEDVRAYVRAVRAWLGDLPADEVEDLTAGMEADLAERAAESGGPLGGLLGQPEAYAAELRSAAGLPPRVERGGAGCRARASRGPTAWRATRTSWWPGIRGCASCDRPGGWPGVPSPGGSLASVLGTGRIAAAPAGRCGAVDVAGARPAPPGAAGHRGCGSRWASATRSPSSCCCRCWRPTRRGRPASPTRSRDAAVATRRWSSPTGSRSATSTPTTPPATGWTTCGCSTSSASRSPVVGLVPAAGRGPTARMPVAWPPDPRVAVGVFPLGSCPGADPWQASRIGWTPPLTPARRVGRGQRDAAADVGARAPSPASPSALAEPSPSASGTP